ncbi:MAG: oligosaccharide flippase family protein [Flavobacterium sp.]|jgi:PST family polysaccharide transporter|uniref:oligosaccharide flippase family protein n=1 Tax=Flavobacterium sp. TaxID=239 RepID=UPI002B48DF17|nr:oligosaccharide flippase family protein [Flavobacterium sp.]WRH73027.1 MAG: oligosaccharide flippase family protein [Flavobacterium sp.]
MNKLIDKLYSKELYKIFSVSGVRILIQLIVGFLSTKAIAFFVGIAGMGVIGLVKTFASFFNNFLLLGTQNGIVTSLASKRKIKNEEIFIVSLFWLFLFLSTFISIIFFIFFEKINKYFFVNQIQSDWILFLFVISIPFQAISLLFNAVLNGKSEYKNVASIGMITNVLTLIVSVFLMLIYNLQGAIIGLLFTSIIMFVISSYFFLKIYSVTIFFQPFQFVKQEIQPLLNYSLMSLVSIIMSFAFSYYMRITIIDKFSLEYAGYYEAVLRISGFYMIFINTFVSFYYLPELAKCSSKVEVMLLTKEYYKKIFPLFVIGLVILLLGVDFFVPFFFNKSFLVITPFVKYQVVLDIIKSICLILGIRFFAFGKTKGFLLTEIFSFTINFILFVIAMHFFDFRGVWYSQIASSFLYFIILVVFFKMYFKKNKLF